METFFNILAGKSIRADDESKRARAQSTSMKERRGKKNKAKHKANSRREKILLAHRNIYRILFFFSRRAIFGHSQAKRDENRARY